MTGVTKPMPKWMGLFWALPIAYGAWKSGDWTSVAAIVGGALGYANTHSLTGTGGKVE